MNFVMKRSAALLGGIGLSILMLGALGVSVSTPGAGGATKTINVGGTWPESGPTAAASIPGYGLTAYFKYVNAHGGIRGYKINYTMLNDKYDPSTTVTDTKELVEQDHIVATLGSLGTPTNLAVRSYLNAQKIPQLFLSTGYNQFSVDEKQYPYTIGFEDQYAEVAAEMAKHLVATDPSAKVAVLLQDTTLGAAYLSSFQRGLKGTKVKIVAKESYAPTTTSLTAQITALKASGANVLMIFSIPGFTGFAMSTAYGLGWHPQFYVDMSSNSSVTMRAVIKDTGSKTSVDGAIAAGFLPDPADPAIADTSGMKLYLKVMKEYCKGCTVDSVYYMHGMAEGWTFVHLVNSVRGAVTSQSIFRAMQHMTQKGNPFLLSGITIHTSPNDYHVVHQLQLFVFKGGATTGSFRPIGKLITAL